jgi:hypothetical protein
VSGWQYWQATIFPEKIREIPGKRFGYHAWEPLHAAVARFDARVNAHLAEMAHNGWELVATTSTILSPYANGHGDGVTVAFHFIWKKAQ